MALILCTGGCAQDAPRSAEVLETYRAQAHDSYVRARQSALRLQDAVTELGKAPSDHNLQQARKAWRVARKDYARTEALRFGNWFVDDWEVWVNAWPIDEGFLDYVAEDRYHATASNPQARANLIASERLQIGGRSLSSDPINRRLLVQAQGLADMESNVATGYHAIEFLLWGQDLNGHGPGAGQRPWTDFSVSPSCTDGPRSAPPDHCQRRHDFLSAASEHLLLRLSEMIAMWGPQQGSYGWRLVHGDGQQGLARMLHGLISMGGEELAGERMQVALLSGSPEEEQDCFSDDTAHSLYFNAMGVEEFYRGRREGQSFGPGLADLAAQRTPALAQKLDQAFAASRTAMQAIRSDAQAFDQLIAPDNPRGHTLLQNAISALQAQSALLEHLASELQLGPLNPQAPR